MADLIEMIERAEVREADIRSVFREMDEGQKRQFEQCARNILIRELGDENASINR